MCTSFIHRSNDVIVAMNFDNNGMKFNIDNKAPDQFTVVVDGGRGYWPSFGVNREGTFINNLLVDPNGRGLYKRASKKVTHTSKLVKDVLNGTIASKDINNYLDNIEVVNGPDFSCHNMISDGKGNVWIVEPGRGIIYSPMNEKPYFIMSNFSLCDYRETGSLTGTGVDRYQIADNMLHGMENLDIKSAFEILEAVMQKDGEWTTDLSMVYSHNESAVYYCFKRDFKKIFKYSFDI